MELVLNLRKPGAGKSGGNREDAGGANAGGLSWVVRLVLAASAIGAAWYIMCDGQFGEIVSGVLGRAHSAAFPAPLGVLFASQPPA